MQNIGVISKKLSEQHPNAVCELDFGTPFELLISVILSAQCTDKRVNIVTSELFKVANTPAAINDMPIEVLESYIHSCGFYRNKAKNIKATALELIERFGGEVPRTMEELTSLSGVGRKTANVMLAVAFHENAFAVDTHVFRLAHRLGLSQGKTPFDVEKDVTALVEPREWGSFHHLLIHHGRYVCKARNPECDVCLIKEYCNYYQNADDNQHIKNVLQDN